MAITLTDFDKIWASSSPLTPYSFSDANYEEGWNFVGATPPARQMWDGYMKFSDEKQQYIVNNFLPLNGGTMTGTITTNGFPAMKHTSNSYNVTIVGGSSTGAGDGAKLILAGADNTDAGAFTVQAGNSGGYKQLVGKATGELTWNGSNVAVMGTLQNGHGILTGRVSNISVNGNSYAQDTVDFGQTFASVPHVIVCCAYGHAFVEAGVRAITTTNFGYTVSNQNTASYTNEAIEWIAIG